ncbi:MAG: ATP-dependent sacrificial sulfur transferase LarE [Methanomicrobiaceae archaeon]|nr:ATP-dependent sacrificial sulfur transferase LarE [Methanomicrobiaceae archaeon]
MTVSGEKLKNLKKYIKDQKSLVVSYSGGVDSTLLGVLAHEILGGLSECAIIKSPLMPEYEFESAVALAGRLRLPLTVLNSEILKNPDFSKNTRDRCYICKKSGAALLKSEAERKGFSNIADGTNFDDIKVFRPGYLAGCEEGIKHPFADCMITKDDIRKIAEAYNLPNSSKSPASCLATRIPYGSTLSEYTLGRIERAEDIIRSYKVSQLRVREIYNSARIEVAAEDMSLILKNRDEISKQLKELGFLYITLDLDGFVSGSMDRKINIGDKKTDSA